MTDDAATAVASPPPVKAGGAFYIETVTYVHHWTDSLFTLRTTRDAGLRFLSGQFVMLGLIVNGKPLLRAYSIASAHYDDGLEFYSIKVQDGPLRNRRPASRVVRRVNRLSVQWCT